MFHVKLFLFFALILPVICFSQHLGTTILPVKEMPSLSSNNVSILEFLKNSPEYESLDTMEKEWFYWTNYSRSNPKGFWDSVIVPMIASFPNLKSAYTESLKRDLYNTKALPLVKPNVELLKISQAFAVDLSSKNAPPSHTSPSGKTFSDRMKSSGIVKCAGENISYGPLNPVLMLVLLYIDEGVPALGHRKTLLNPSFVEMGIGVAKYKNGNSIVIQDFACAQKQ
ncbi:MAG TPA: CAP domain-containing protein [Segetibacter sp.]|nr:CAP domain-containing protein [Segetibacter sp.]